VGHAWHHRQWHMLSCNKLVALSPGIVIHIEAFSKPSSRKHRAYEETVTQNVRHKLQWQPARYAYPWQVIKKSIMSTEVIMSEMHYIWKCTLCQQIMPRIYSNNVAIICYYINRSNYVRNTSQQFEFTHKLVLKHYQNPDISWEGKIVTKNGFTLMKIMRESTPSRITSHGYRLTEYTFSWEFTATNYFHESSSWRSHSRK
jgi:hypothetical protein